MHLSPTAEKHYFGSQRIAKIVKLAKRFWKKASLDLCQSLSQPQNLPEFEAFLSELQKLDVSEISDSDCFQSKLISSSESQSLLIFSNKKIRVELFFFPPNFIFDIHDHREMLLVTKILSGQLEMSKFHMMNSESIYNQVDRGKFSKAAVQRTSVNLMTTGDIDILYPDRSNLHSIVCQKRVIYLDIMFNSYEHTKKECNFFKLGENIEGEYFEMFYFQ